LFAGFIATMTRSDHTTANPGDKDGLNFNANLGVGPYSVVILSQ